MTLIKVCCHDRCARTNESTNQRRQLHFVDGDKKARMKSTLSNSNAFYVLDMAIYSNVAPKIQVAAYLQNNQQVLLTVFFVTNLWL